MTKTLQNSAAAMASLLIVAITFAPLLNIPSAQAANILAIPVLV